MANFEIAYKIIAAAEGGYSNNPKDAGGETWAGIARKKNPNWKGWAIIDDLKRTTGFPAILKSNAQLQQLVVSFYKSNYWDINSEDAINNQDIANKLCDIAVNCGTGFAAKALQRTLNVANQNGKYYPDLSVDGKIGPVTIAAVNKHPHPEVIYKCLNVLQGEHYIDIGESSPSQEAFINGWFLNRIAGIVDENKYNNIA